MTTSKPSYIRLIIIALVLLTQLALVIPITLFIVPQLSQWDEPNYQDRTYSPTIEIKVALAVSILTIIFSTIQLIYLVHGTRQWIFSFAMLYAFLWSNTGTITVCVSQGKAYSWRKCCGEECKIDIPAGCTPWEKIRIFSSLEFVLFMLLACLSARIPKDKEEDESDEEQREQAERPSQPVRWSSINDPRRASEIITMGLRRH